MIYYDWPFSYGLAVAARRKKRIDLQLSLQRKRKSYLEKGLFSLSWSMRHGFLKMALSSSRYMLAMAFTQKIYRKFHCGRHEKTSTLFLTHFWKSLWWGIFFEDFYFCWKNFKYLTRLDFFKFPALFNRLRQIWSKIWNFGFWAIFCKIKIIIKYSNLVLKLSTSWKLRKVNDAAVNAWYFAQFKAIFLHTHWHT